MSSVDRIFQLMKDRKLTAAFVSKQTGISAGNFTDWKKGRSKPGAKTINKLAEYLEVSSDYLLGRTDDPAPPVTASAIGYGSKEYAITGLSKEEFQDISDYLEFYRAKKRKE